MPSIQPPLISTGTLTRESLRGRVAVVSGAGEGIGYEAARALAWLGAHVVIAEVDRRMGRKAEARIAAEMGEGITTFIQTDIGDERAVNRMTRRLETGVGKADIIINNATVMPVGSVLDKAVQDWDRSYRVNVRGSVLLAQAFLPGMLKRKFGAFVCIASSGTAPYMGAYGVFKTAQVELASVLAAELQDSGVYVLTVDPGLVPTTPGASAAIAKVAPLYGKSAEEFSAMHHERVVSAEAAGVSVAVGAALASQFHGQRVDSTQLLAAAGISLSTDG